LSARRVVRLDGLDSERFTLAVPTGATGATPFEEAVLAALRPQGQVHASATLTGPPLWADDAGPLVRRLRALLLREGKRRDLVRVTLSALVLVPAALAMGIVALVGSVGASPLAWIAAVGGPFVALLAAVLTGMSLTRAGRRERRSWKAYGDWLRANADLTDVGAPGVAVWGDVLAYATVLGAAPTAARALSPR
jgi:hypothetical protein